MSWIDTFAAKPKTISIPVHSRTGLTMLTIYVKRISPRWHLIFSQYLPCQRIQKDFLAGIVPSSIFLIWIPGRTVEYSHLRSSKLLINDRRNRLGDDIIEASECLKSWAACGIGYGGINSDVNRMERTSKALELYSLGLRSPSVVWNHCLLLSFSFYLHLLFSFTS